MTQPSPSLEQTIKKYKLIWQTILQACNRFLKSKYAPKAVFATLIAAVIYYIFSFSYISILAQQTFSTSAYDVGLYDQGIWLLSRFQAPFTTIKGVNLFGDHASLYSLLLAPFFWLWPNINLLYIMQTILLALGAIPLFLYARQRLNSSFLALAVGLSFLLYPALQNMNLENFHPEVMALFFLTMTVYFMLQKNFRWFYPFLILSVLGKEDIGLTAAFIGLYLLIIKEKEHGIRTIVIGLGWYFLSSRVLMPLLNGINIFGPQPTVYSFWFQNYMRNIFNPVYYFKMFFAGKAIVYIKDLLGPALFLPLLAPAMLLMLLPALAMNILSGSDYLRSIYFHYNYVTICFVYFGLIEGLALLSRIPMTAKIRIRGAITLGTILLLIAFVSNTRASQFPFSRHLPIIKNYRQILSLKRIEARQQALKLIPAEANVSASYSFVPHLTHRKNIYMFPNPFKAALWNMWFKEGKDIPAFSKKIDYVVLNLGDQNGEDLLIFDYLRNSLYFEEIYYEKQVVVLKRTKFSSDKVHGANYVQFEYNKPISVVGDISNRLKVKRRGKLSNIYFPKSNYYFRNLLGEGVETNSGVALQILGFLFVPESGIYKFNLETQAEVLMEVDGQNIEGPIKLTKGLHRYNINYLNKKKAFDLRLTITPSTGKTYIIPDEHLFYRYNEIQLKKLLREYDERRLKYLNQPNRVQNGSFEKAHGNKPKGWKVEAWKAEEAICAYSVTSNVRRLGKYSARIEHDGLADSRFVQEVEVEPDTFYKLSGWIKVDSVAKDGRGAYLEIQGTGLKTEVLSGTTGWQKVEVTGKTNSDQETVKILCRLGDYGVPNSGVAYFDGVEFKKEPIH